MSASGFAYPADIGQSAERKTTTVACLPTRSFHATRSPVGVRKESPATGGRGSPPRPVGKSSARPATADVSSARVRFVGMAFGPREGWTTRQTPGVIIRRLRHLTSGSQYRRRPTVRFSPAPLQGSGGGLIVASLFPVRVYFR